VIFSKVVTKSFGACFKFLFDEKINQGEEKMKVSEKKCNNQLVMVQM